MVQRIKYFWIRYYELNRVKDTFDLRGEKVDAKELAEFIINNAYNNDIMILGVKEI